MAELPGTESLVGRHALNLRAELGHAVAIPSRDGSKSTHTQPAYARLCPPVPARAGPRRPAPAYARPPYLVSRNSLPRPTSSTDATTVAAPPISSAAGVPKRWAIAPKSSEPIGAIPTKASE